MMMTIEKVKFDYLSEARLRAVSVESWDVDVDDGDDINDDDGDYNDLSEARLRTVSMESWESGRRGD